MLSAIKKYKNCTPSLPSKFAHTDARTHTNRTTMPFSRGILFLLISEFFIGLCYSHFSCLSRYSESEPGGSYKPTQDVYFHHYVFAFTHLLSVPQTAHFSSKCSFVLLLIFLPLLFSRIERGHVNACARKQTNADSEIKQPIYNKWHLYKYRRHVSLHCLQMQEHKQANKHFRRMLM